MQSHGYFSQGNKKKTPAISLLTVLSRAIHCWEGWVVLGTYWKRSADCILQRRT